MASASESPPETSSWTSRKTRTSAGDADCADNTVSRAQQRHARAQQVGQLLVHHPDLRQLHPPRATGQQRLLRRADLVELHRQQRPLGSTRAAPAVVSATSVPCTSSPSELRAR